MIDSSDIAFVFKLEKNKEVLSKTGKISKRFYEYELINSIRSIRKNAGILKDCNIYCISYGKTISQQTISLLKQYNNTYLELNDDISLDNKYNFYSCLYTSRVCEINKNIHENILIQLDLDAVFLQPLKNEWIEQATNNLVLVYHDKIDLPFDKFFEYRYYNILNLNGHSFDSYFKIWNKKTNIHKNILEYFFSKEYKAWFDKYVNYNSYDSYYIFEEALYDYIYTNKLLDTYIIQYSEFVKYIEAYELTTKDVFMLKKSNDYVYLDV